MIVLQHNLFLVKKKRKGASVGSPIGSGWIGSRKGCTCEQEILNLFPIFQKNIQKRTSQISASLIHPGWSVPTLPVDWALVHWIELESSLTYIHSSAELLLLHPPHPPPWYQIDHVICSLNTWCCQSKSQWKFQHLSFSSLDWMKETLWLQTLNTAVKIKCLVSLPSLKTIADGREIFIIEFKTGLKLRTWVFKTQRHNDTWL